jgi:hypothetical protein
MASDNRDCNCGSGLPSHWEYDARNIPLVRVCTKCKTDRLAGYRTEVLNNPSYECDEQIEPLD